MKERNQILPLIAAITMLIDHIGGILFPSMIWLRIVGRVSFPLYAYGIAQGVIHTSDFKKYEMRILLTAIVSQPICMMLFGKVFSNPLITLAYGALVLWFWRAEQKTIAAGLLMVSLFLPLEYGTYGILTILVFGIWKEISLNLGQGMLQIYFYLCTGSWIQVFSLAALPLIHKQWKWNVTLPKYIMYGFYPLHLAVLLAVKNWM